MLVITGLGRCGTSFVSAILERCGRGPGGDFNPEVRAGYENPRLSEINNVIGRSYPVSGPGCAEPFRAQIQACPRLVVKDPRFVSKPGVLDAWLRFRQDLKFLVMFREPRDSVASARASISKDRTPETFGEDVLSAERALDVAMWTLLRSNAPFAVVRFPSVLRDPGSLYEALWYLGHRIPRPVFDQAFRDVADNQMVTVRSFPSPASGEMGFGVVPGSDIYNRIGDQFVEMLRSLADMRPEDRLLDVGCGFGRIARALASSCACRQYLGLDVVQYAVAYCRDRISYVNGAFQFRWIDVANPMYHPGGSVPADECVWPVDDASFERCLAASLFTHLRPDHVRRYLAEAFRVLIPGGTFMSSWFLETPESIPALRAQRHNPWVQTDQGYWVSQPKMHEAAIAHQLESVREWCAAAGFEVVSVNDGKWAKPSSPLACGQDVVVLRKPE